jgi:phosphoribosylamine--glycine ligase
LIGVLLVSYGSREACIADTLARSQERVRLFIADKQRNPFNLRLTERTGGEHVVIPDLNLEDIVRFAKKHEDSIDFGVLGPEGPGMKGLRDRIEAETKVKMICPTFSFFIERSKVEQRKVIAKACPQANPEFRVFFPADYSSVEEVKRDVYDWLDEIGDEVAVKPDAPATGKGVGVWGDHFSSREEMFEKFFIPNFEKGPVIVERKLEGEEFSLQFLSDGRHLIPTPAVRDYKRSFEWDRGPNTGGMGSYKDREEILPFMSPADWREALEIGERVHGFLSGPYGNSGLRGVMYFGFISTAEGVKVLEINSRWGDPEVMNVLTVLEDDLVEVCLKTIDGNLGRLHFRKGATVVTYAVPLDYGGYARYSGPKPVDISDAERLREKYGDRIRIYPGSLEVVDGRMFALSSRTVAVVGIADDLEEARRISLDGIRRIDGPLRHREDIALLEHIERSISHMQSLRSKSQVS